MEPPKLARTYREVDYWNSRFKIETSKEWVCSFDQVAATLIPLINSSGPVDKDCKKILIVGCGNSCFSADLYRAGFHNITNIDFRCTYNEACQVICSIFISQILFIAAKLW